MKNKRLLMKRLIWIMILIISIPRTSNEGLVKSRCGKLSAGKYETLTKIKYNLLLAHIISRYILFSIKVKRLVFLLHSENMHLFAIQEVFTIFTCACMKSRNLTAK